MRTWSSLQRAILSWGLAGVIGVPLLVFLDPLGGWRWSPHNGIYDQMIVSIYFVLGVFCLRSLNAPLRHAQFLWFVVWSSLAHGSVMLLHALEDNMHRGHLLGDVWILAGALTLGIPLWRAERAVDRRTYIASQG